MNLENKNIILTGASAGIGLEILKILSQYPNIKIIAVARHTDTIPVLEGIIFPYAADVSTKEGVDSVFEYAINTISTIDVFIANAGFAYLEKIGNADWTHIEKIYALNVFSPIYSLEKLIKMKGEKAFACTISGAGLVSLPAYSLYCSSKAALHHFIKTYRYEKRNDLQITAIYPVATKTGFFDNATGQSNTPLPWPQQEAKLVARKYINGIVKGKKEVFPSLLFNYFYPIGRALPIFLKLYSLIEKRKVKRWLNTGI